MSGDDESWGESISLGKIGSLLLKAHWAMGELLYQQKAEYEREFASVEERAAATIAATKEDAAAVIAATKMRLPLPLPL